MEQSQINTTPPAFIPLPVDDLLGDVANQPLPPDTKPYETMRGDVPTESEIQQMAPDSPSSAKILPFAPRTTRPAEPATPASTPASDDYEQILAQVSSDQFAPTPIGIDVATREGISATVQELLFCANVGEFMHGFALYTDRYLFQFMTESGFDEDSFRETFSAIPGKEPQDWTRIENIVAARRLDDGRVTADVTYLDQRHPVAPERFTFKLDVITGRWLIDGIAPVSG